MPKIQPTNVRRLSEEICHKPYRFALPTSLPDQWIKPIVRDLRQIEKMKRGDTRVEPNFAGPLLIALHVTTGRMKEKGLVHDFHFSEPQMTSWFQMYQYFIEREMVSRIVGVEIPGDEVSLVEAIDREIDVL
jgi:hypothetical protein